MKMTTWAALISEEMKTHGDCMAHVVAWAIGEDTEHGDGPLHDLFHREFNCGMGCAEGDPFTLWTSGRVYFPCVYDGIDYVGSAPRDPCSTATEHI